MSRGPWQRIREVKASLASSLERGRHPAGSRFLSSRALAERHQISLQTADRIIQELVREGWLERRPSSGTFVLSSQWRAAGALLVFHSRGRRSGSFGEKLLGHLLRALRALDVPVRVHWTDEDPPGPEGLSGWYPLFWEAEPEDLPPGLAPGRGMILNNRPPDGLAGAGLDSVRVDDVRGGAMAAELMLKAGRKVLRPAALGGPDDDPRSRARLAGFGSVLPAPQVSSGWSGPEALAGAEKVLALDPDSVFCASDRLAEAVVRRCRAKGRSLPLLVGFDDAPVAERLHLNTVAIPWEELAASAAQIAHQRMTDREGAGVAVVVTPRPVLRSPFVLPLPPSSEGPS